MICSLLIFWALPQGSGYPLYLLLHFVSQKDAAAIPNANSAFIQAQNKRTTIFLVTQLFF
ncbi:hypothetical protein Q764_01460 [Flavobacterium suncheonense GH29-5 = DSM 17707]|uniref:Uncharacterized protein n=1 Tax=Flavobacterium suncheonense GH29-5 = DSM 17707 TaxID=1121899 RepID=A0A0A2MH81_9FLAO|nr:hypothetical protein Q764_01460 [Flavobacterium suncheonense GH29-5 = DSM 17707]